MRRRSCLKTRIHVSSPPSAVALFLPFFSRYRLKLLLNLKEVLKTIIKRFNEEGIDFVLSGGLALNTMRRFNKSRNASTKGG